MALPPGAPAFRSGKASSLNGTAPQTSANQQEALLRSVPVRKNGKKTLEGQGRQQAYDKDAYTTRTDRVRGPARVHLTRADRAAEGQTDTTTIQIRNSICRKILGIHIRIPTKVSHERGNSASQACIRAIL